MKCPKCHHNQRYREGMTCRECRYRFALSPKVPPNLTDLGMIRIIDRLSTFGQFYFTRHQLLAAVYRMLVRKRTRSRRLSAVVWAIVLGGSGIIFGGFPVMFPLWVYGAFLLAVVWLAVWIARRPVKIRFGEVDGAVTTYLTVHPPDRLADGTAFSKTPPPPFDDELAAYAPEQVLIVERDDIADMLILNRYHLEQKTLVVSARKYPQAAFTAFKRFIAAHPDLRVVLIHDLSKAGHRLRNDLESDPDWGLPRGAIVDLGLHHTDVDRLKTPLWLPTTKVSGKLDRARIETEGRAIDQLQSGRYVPVDAAPPRTMLAAFTLAVAAGLPLASEELLALQAQDAASGGVGTGGFG